jgi:hypothetical protein
MLRYLFQGYADTLTLATTLRPPVRAAHTRQPVVDKPEPGLVEQRTWLQRLRAIYAPPDRPAHKSLVRGTRGTP